MRTHDLTGPAGVTLLRILRGDEPVRAAQPQRFTPWPHCQVLVRGAHSCESGRAAA